MALRIETVTSPSALAALQAEWRGLAAQAEVQVPFATWEWAVSWWANLAARGADVRDTLALRLVREQPGGILVAVAPWMVTERNILGLHVRALQCLGADPNLTELRAILCRPEHEDAVAELLLDHVREHASEWHWTLWSGMDASGALARRLATEPHVRWSADSVACLLPLASSWRALRAGLPRNIRESLRKAYNAPLRDGLRLDFQVLTTSAEIIDSLPVLFDLHRRRAQRTDTVRHGNVFATARARAFVREVCERLGQRGAVRLFVLRLGDQTVAARLAFVLGGTLYVYYSGYEPAYGRYSVMTRLVAEAIQYAIGSGLERVHLSMGEDVSKTRWRPQLLPVREAYQLGQAPHALLAYYLYRGARGFVTKSPLIRQLPTLPTRQARP